MPQAMTISMTLRDRDFNEVTVEMPAHFEVCPRCEGTGTHVHEGVDGNGLSAQDFAEDPDFKEQYFAGVYDVTCTECCGKRVVPVVDVQKCTYAQKRLLVSQREWDRAGARMRAEEAAERRYFGY